MGYLHTAVAAASAVLVTAAMFALAGPAWSAPVVIDFEDLQGLRGPGAGTGEPVTDQYADRGVQFNGPLALDYAQAFPAPMPDFPHVGTAAIEPCYAHEFCTTPARMTFAELQQRVRVWVGYSSPLVEPVDVLLVAFDPDGNVVGRTAERLGPSPDSVPIDTPLEVTVPAASIASAQVGHAGIDTGLAVDAIEFEQGSAEIELSDVGVVFGDVEVGARAPHTLTATNVGTADLTIDSVELTDGDTDAFTVTDDGCSQQTLPPDATCDLTVVHQPTDATQRQAILTLATNDPASPHTITLAGTGVDRGQPGLVEVPDLVGRTLEEAEEAVSAAGLSLQPEPADGADVATVETQDPLPGTLVEAGRPVAVTLSGDPALGWLIWAVAFLAATAGPTFAKAMRRRSSRWVHKHVRVRPRSEFPVEPTTNELDGRASHAVRIVSHADAGDLTVHEVTR